LLDHALELGRQFLDLLRADILAREHDVFVKGHAMPFPCLQPSRRQALRALWERLESKFEGGNTGRRVTRPCRRLSHGETMSSEGMPRGRPFSSRPGSSGSGRYT